MQIINEQTVIFPPSSPCSLTIGMFDGMHLGHQKILQQLRKKAGSGTAAVFSFNNHPRDVLQPNREKIPTLCSQEYKIRLLEEQKVDLLLLYTFTQEFATQSFDSFLEKMHEKLKFSHLVLGEGASFGKNREGTPEKVEALGKNKGFSVTYLTKELFKGIPISSSRIRKTLQQGNLSEAQDMLGRPFSILLNAHPKDAMIIENDFRVLSFPLKTICLPPSGFYFATMEQSLPILVHVSHIPESLLEIYFISQENFRPSKALTICFQRYIKENFEFQTVEQLREQIAYELKKLS